MYYLKTNETETHISKCYCKTKYGITCPMNSAQSGIWNDGITSFPMNCHINNLIIRYAQKTARKTQRNFEVWEKALISVCI